MKKLIALAAAIGIGGAALFSSGASAFTQHTSTFTYTVIPAYASIMCSPSLVTFPLGPYTGLPVVSRTLINPTTCLVTMYFYY